MLYNMGVLFWSNSRQLNVLKQDVDITDAKQKQDILVNESQGRKGKKFLSE